jgi:pyridoxal 5'-phosphate synthase pdxS subunit
MAVLFFGSSVEAFVGGSGAVIATCRSTWLRPENASYNAAMAASLGSLTIGFRRSLKASSENCNGIIRRNMRENLNLSDRCFRYLHCRDRMRVTKEIIEEKGTDRLKRGFAKMCKGGVIMDVVNGDQAKIAEDAGAVSVMALEAVPADIRAKGGVARMADPQKIKEITNAVTIPVMAKCRIGHFAEAQVLEALGVDMADESEVLTPADEEDHIDKRKFTIPFVCGARNLGEALRRVNEGAAMIRTKGEPGTGNVVEAVRHMKLVNREIAELRKMPEPQLKKKAKEYRVPLKLVIETRDLGRLPVVNFAAGGISTPSDAALMMQLGADGIFVGSGVFKSKNPRAYAEAIVKAAMHYDDPKTLAKVSEGLGEPMEGIDTSKMDEKQKMQIRGTD